MNLLIDYRNDLLTFDTHNPDETTVVLSTIIPPVLRLVPRMSHLNAGEEILFSRGSVTRDTFAFDEIVINAQEAMRLYRILGNAQ